MPRLVRKIFLIDDSDDDEFFVRRTATKMGITNRIVRLPGGPEALTFFRASHGEPGQDLHTFCDLVFLDINMPSVGGFAVLQWLRANRTILPLPLIVMLSSSDHLPDIARAQELGADSYVMKPVRPRDFIRLADEFSLFWARAELVTPSA